MTDSAFATAISSNQQAEPVGTIQERIQQTFDMANMLFAQKPDWVVFFREVLGVGGIARRLFASIRDYAEFELSKEFRDIQQMLAKLREASPEGKESAAETTRVITVRMPQSLHSSLITEAGSRNISMNQLCISNLLQMIEDDLLPTEDKKERKTKKRNRKLKGEVKRIEISPSDM